MEKLEAWKAAGESVEVTITTKATARGQEEPQGPGTLYLKALDGRARTVRAARALALCWGAALLSVPILFFHFLLVPGFLIAGPVLFWLRLKEERIILGAVLSCAACAAPTKLKSRAEEWPTVVVCAGCGKQLSLEPAVPRPSE